MLEGHKSLCHFATFLVHIENRRNNIECYYLLIMLIFQQINQIHFNTQLNSETHKNAVKLSCSVRLQTECKKHGPSHFIFHFLLNVIVVNSSSTSGKFGQTLGCNSRAQMTTYFILGEKKERGFECYCQIILITDASKIQGTAVQGVEIPSVPGRIVESIFPVLLKGIFHYFLMYYLFAKQTHFLLPCKDI